MHRYFKAIFLFAVAAICLFSFTASAEQPAEQSIRFSACCESVDDINEAVDLGADFISITGALSYEEAAAAVSGKACLIIDAQDKAKAEELHLKATLSGTQCDVRYRIKDGAGDVVKWADSKNVKIIGYYKGNIWPVALSAVSKYGKQTEGAIIQLQTNNQDGVILHNSVTSHFDKHGAEGMFSFTDSTRSAKRTDSPRSWDDLIARGYTIIETSYPADFAEYLKSNTAEREKLEKSVSKALSTPTEGCSPNRVADYTAALEAAQSLLSDGSSATFAMADSRTVLDEAVANITIQDGSQLKGDIKLTPGRIAWALFGIALVLSWQIFFRSRWAKKKEN